MSLTRAAWAAAEQCTGREGRARDLVELRHRSIPGGYLAVAHTDHARRLFRIDLDAPEGRSREALVHEVAHAWVSRGPLVLVEGATALLADCIARRVPGLSQLQFDDGRDLTGLGDLRDWRVPGEREPEALGSIRTDAYVGAARLVRTAALVTGDSRRLWPERGLSWERFETLMREADGGELVLATLNGGRAVQRTALADRDQDGLSALAESVLGTSDARYDSDEDGWWDGAADVPAGALPLPLDGTPVCSGLAGSAAGAATRVRTGGNLRGHRPPHAVVRPGDAPLGWAAPDRDGGWGLTTARVAPGSPILLQLGRPASHTSGGAWATVEGLGMDVDGACLSTAARTVWATQPDLAGVVPAVAQALDRALAISERRLGPTAGRVALALGGDTSTVDRDVVWLSSHEVAAAGARDDLEHLGYLAVAVHGMWARGERDWRAGEALALWLRD